MVYDDRLRELPRILFGIDESEYCGRFDRSGDQYWRLRVTRGNGIDGALPRGHSPTVGMTLWAPNAMTEDLVAMVSLAFEDIVRYGSMLFDLLVIHRAAMPPYLRGHLDRCLEVEAQFQRERVSI